MDVDIFLHLFSFTSLIIWICPSCSSSSSSPLLSYKTTLKVAPEHYNQGLGVKLTNCTCTGTRTQTQKHLRLGTTTKHTHTHCCEWFSWQSSAELIAVQTWQRSDVMNQSHMHQSIQQLQPRPQAVLTFDGLQERTDLGRLRYYRISGGTRQFNWHTVSTATWSSDTDQSEPHTHRMWKTFRQTCPTSLDSPRLPSQ